MDLDPRPTPDRLSPDSRIPFGWIAGIAVLVAIVALAAGLMIPPMLAGPDADEQRAIAAREHPSQQTPEAIAALPEPGPVADPNAAATAAAVSPAMPSQMGEAFVERFGGAEISSRWFLSDGWANGPWMANDWRASAVELTPDGLALHLRPGPPGSAFELAGGEIRTHAYYRYGYFEVRMKLPRDPGIVVGAFTYADRTADVRPNEIDIEILGRAPNVAELTIHENGRATSKKITLPFDTSQGFHTYGFDWQPNHVRWYVDGRMIHEETGKAARNLVRPQQLLFSLWASRELSSWVGNLDTSRGPWRLDLGCIAYAPTYSGEICI